MMSIENVGGNPLNERVDPEGAGIYTIQDYTLTLRYSNGLTERMMFFVPPDENPK